jgi:hypothetical protein
MTDNTNSLVAEYIGSWTKELLRDEMRVTDEELIYAARIQQLRHKEKIDIE